jgi:DNA-binding NtrC family response regulator
MLRLAGFVLQILRLPSPGVQDAGDLVIADISLPDGSGIELLSQAADASPAKGILVSGHEEELYESYLDKRAWGDFLLKPLVFETLLATIRRVLGTASRERVLI